MRTFIFGSRTVRKSFTNDSKPVVFHAKVGVAKRLSRDAADDHAYSNFRLVSTPPRLFFSFFLDNDADLLNWRNTMRKSKKSAATPVKRRRLFNRSFSSMSEADDFDKRCGRAKGGTMYITVGAIGSGKRR